MTREVAKVERNAAVLAAVRVGERQTAVAKRFGLSRGMVGIIVACDRYDQRLFARDNGPLAAWLGAKAAKRPEERGAFVRIARHLAKRSIATLDGLCALSGQELTDWRRLSAARGEAYVYQLGPQTLRVLREVLAEDGLALRPDDPPPPPPRARRAPAVRGAPPPR